MYQQPTFILKNNNKKKKKLNVTSFPISQKHQSGNILCKEPITIACMT